MELAELGTACTVPITPRMSAREVAAAAATQGALALTADHALRETLEPRPGADEAWHRCLPDAAMVLAAMARWKGPGSLALVAYPQKQLLAAPRHVRACCRAGRSAV